MPWLMEMTRGNYWPVFHSCVIEIDVKTFILELDLYIKKV